MGLFDWLKLALQPVQPVEVNVSDLPHLARIAFAARCARTVQPLFIELWPVAPQQVSDSLEEAIATVEKVAESGLVPHDLEDVKLRATMATGRAFRYGPNYSSLVVRVALQAVRAACGGEEYSGRDCLEAFSDAIDCIHYMRRPQLLEQLERDYVLLRQWLEKSAAGNPITVPKNIWPR